MSYTNAARGGASLTVIQELIDAPHDLVIAGAIRLKDANMPVQTQDGTQIFSVDNTSDGDPMGGETYSPDGLGVRMHRDRNGMEFFNAINEQTSSIVFEDGIFNAGQFNATRAELSYAGFKAYAPSELNTINLSSEDGTVNAWAATFGNGADSTAGTILGDASGGDNTQGWYGDVTDPESILAYMTAFGDLNMVEGVITAGFITATQAFQVGDVAIGPFINSTGTLTFGTIAAGGYEEQTLTLTGLIAGIKIAAALPVMVADAVCTFWPVTNGVVFRISNNKLVGTITPGAQTYSAVGINV